MKRWRQTLGATTLGVLLAGGVGFSGPTVEASLFDVLLGGAVGMMEVNTGISNLDDTEQGQQYMLEQRKSQMGYYNNYAYQDRAKRIFDALTSTPDVKRTYVVFVNPQTDANASMGIGRVMTINKGLMDMLDDDALASVVGHEIGHGENKDLVRGLRKSVALQTAVGAATNNAGSLSVLLGNAAGNYLNEQVFSMSQEKKADEWGFKLLADSHFNVGAAAVSMAVIRDKYGELYTDGLGQIINPNDHPKMSQRILDHLKRLHTFSNKHVEVKDDVVYVNNQPVYTGEAAGNYTGAMRAYLVAGKLARYYHDNQVGEPVVQGNQVWMNGSSLVILSSPDKAQTMGQALSQAIAKGDSKADKKAKAKK
ncbi:M48 family metallopeptidase [Veillonella sp. R32]|uniref:M48 family metallopeptidase n=1 Tax=Veillonella sp. R32 TaxID=2021312 RepID=UPI001389BEE0|nr:M48 family metallopeptidase [Veillonella sp. R32]KAF1682557.1 peptidase M48 [Veillonella sp. R32]